MNPCELNAAIAAITNHLYCNLKEKDFVNLGVLLSLLSKNMLSMAAVEELCKIEHKDKHRCRDKEKGKDKDREERSSKVC